MSNWLTGGGGSTTPSKTSRTSSGTRRKPLTGKRSFRNDENEKAFRAYKKGGGPMGAKEWYQGIRKPAVRKPGQRKQNFLDMVVGDVSEAFGAIAKDTAKAVITGGKQAVLLAQGKGKEAAREGKKFYKDSRLIAPVAEFVSDPETWKATGRVLGEGVKDVFSTKTTDPRTKAAKAKAKKKVKDIQKSALVFVPGATTLAQSATPEGRREIAKHPGFALLDLAPAIGKAGRVAGKGVGKAAEAAARTKPGAVVQARTAAVRGSISPKGAKVAAAVPRAIREVQESARSRTSGIIKDAGKLTEEDSVALGEMLQRGERPPVEHRLHNLYNEMEGSSGRLLREGLVRELPSEASVLIRHKILENTRHGKPAYQRLTEDIARRASLEEAPGIVKNLTDSFLRGADENPLPQFDRHWEWLKRQESYVTRVQTNKRRLHVDPETGEVYNYDHFSRLNRLNRRVVRAENRQAMAGEQATTIQERLATWKRELEVAKVAPPAHHFRAPQGRAGRALPLPRRRQATGHRTARTPRA